MNKDRSALQIQKDVIFALIQRELKTYFGTTKIGYMWIILEPLLHILPFYVIKLAVGIEYKVDLFLFLITGFLPFFLISHTISKSVGVVRGNRSLFMYKIVRPIDAIMTRVLIEFIIFILAFFLFFVAFNFINQTAFFIKNPLELIGIIVTLVTFALSIGIITAVSMSLYPDFDKIPSFIIRFFYFTSGLFFFAADFPIVVQNYLYLNPILHLIELFRFNIFAEISYTNANYYYPIMCTFSLLFVSLLFYRKNRFKIILRR